jgi:hypothetical protein
MGNAKGDPAKNRYFRRIIEGCRATRPTKGRNDSGMVREVPTVT